jgi:cytochrome c-type biogenesis protein CcmH
LALATPKQGTMKVFVLVAALMTSLAIVLVATPLLRAGRNRWTALIAAVLIPIVAAALYGRWSTGIGMVRSATAVARKSAEPSAASGVFELEERVAAQPDNIDGWLMLGRSYLEVGRADDAVAAFARAYRLGHGSSAAAALSLGEALSLRAGGRMTSDAGRLFEEAIALAPHDPHALLASGIAAAHRGDVAQARHRWQELMGMHPAPKVAAMLEARLAAMDEQSKASP